MTDTQWMTLALLFSPFVLGGLAWLINTHIKAVRESRQWVGGYPDLMPIRHSTTNWVGLTNAEWLEIVENESIDTLGAIKNAIESKLKGKNMQLATQPAIRNKSYEQIAEAMYHAYCKQAERVDEEGLAGHAYAWADLDPETQSCWVAAAKQAAAELALGR